MPLVIPPRTRDIGLLLSTLSSLFWLVSVLRMSEEFCCVPRAWTMSALHDLHSVGCICDELTNLRPTSVVDIEVQNQVFTIVGNTQHPPDFRASKAYGRPIHKFYSMLHSDRMPSAAGKCGKRLVAKVVPAESIIFIFRCSLRMILNVTHTWSQINLFIYH